MNFPKIYEITTTEVSKVSIDASLCEAIELMFQSEHRHIVVTDKNHFYSLGIYDVLRLSRAYLDKQLPLRDISLSSLPTLHKDKNIFDALEFVRHDYEHIVVVDDMGELYGIVSQTDILSSIDPDTMMDVFKISDLLKIRKRTRWVDKEMLTEEIFRFMETYNHDATMIVEERKPLGIITAKDMLHLLKQHKDLSLPVKHYMTTPVITLPHDTSLKEALAFMQDKHFKRIVTVDEEGHLVGIITQKELISMAYTRWVKMMEAYQSELRQINERLEKKSRRYEKSAQTDPLTGLYNRMKFLELFVAEYNIMVQRDNHLSLLVIDIDHFKAVNDSWGHNVGDEVLVEVSEVLTKTLRSVDIVCRWGGEEFVALLPAASIDEAYRSAERIRQNIKKHTFKNNKVSVTVSIGVTEIREKDDLRSVIERADKALYKAKKAGRDNVRKSL